MKRLVTFLRRLCCLGHLWEHVANLPIQDAHLYRCRKCGTEGALYADPTFETQGDI